MESGHTGAVPGDLNEAPSPPSPALQDEDEPFFASSKYVYHHPSYFLRPPHSLSAPILLTRSQINEQKKERGDGQRDTVESTTEITTRWSRQYRRPCTRCRVSTTSNWQRNAKKYRLNWPILVCKYWKSSVPCSSAHTIAAVPSASFCACSEHTLLSQPTLPCNLCSLVK